MWSDWLVFCNNGFCVSALWCPLATPTLLLGFLLPWSWGISSRLLQQSAAAALTLDEGYLLTAASADLEHGVAPLSPPAPMQPPLLGCGVAPLGFCPWPWAQGSSYRLPPLTLGVGKFLSATPAPSQPGALGRCLWPRKWAWWLLKPLEPAYWVANCFRC